MTDSLGIIVIGGSSDGIEALSTVLRSLTPELPLAVAAVLHTAPDSPRHLACAIGAQTSLPVLYATQGTHIKAGHIYFAPPDYHLVVAAPGLLGLEVGAGIRYSRPAADRLFESAVEAYADRVIGVMLGAGEGAAGMQAIKAAEGIGVVQHPDECGVHPMTRTALVDDQADYASRLSEMGALLEELSMRIASKAFRPAGESGLGTHI